MTNNPRKFADKLEIIKRKQEESDAAFDEVMREVSNAKVGVNMGHDWMRRDGNNVMSKMRMKFKGGSLPNVNFAQNQNSMSMPQGMYMNELYSQQQQLQPVLPCQPAVQRRHHQYQPMSPIKRAVEQPGPIFPSKFKQRTHTSPYQNIPLTKEEQLQEAESNLSSMWRRTYSDSAILQTLQQPPIKKNYPVNDDNHNIPESDLKTQSLHTQTRNTNYSSMQPIGYSSSAVNHTIAQHHAQIQANTNSLPDLSNLNIPSPIQNPIDGDDAPISRQTDNHSPFQIPMIPSQSRRRTISGGNRQLGTFPMSMSATSSHSNTLITSGGNTPEDYQSLNINVDQRNNDLRLRMGLDPSSPLPGNAGQSPCPASPVSPINNAGGRYIQTVGYWKAPSPISPLATDELHPAPTNIDLQQQLHQFKMVDLSPTQTTHMQPPQKTHYPVAVDDKYWQPAVYQIMSVSGNESSISNGGFGVGELLPLQGKGNSTQMFRSFQPHTQATSLQNEEDLNPLPLDALDFDAFKLLSGSDVDFVDQSTEEQLRNDWNQC